jgi:hypothetical protein
VPSATPSTFFDLDDFDCTSDWAIGTTPPSYLCNPSFLSGASGTEAIVASPSFAGGQSFEVSVTNWGAGIGASAGYALMQFECGDPYDWDNATQSANACNATAGYNGAPTDLTTGTTGVTGSFTPSFMSAQIYSAGGPVTLAYVSVYDENGNHAECPLSMNIPNGVWTNVVVELTSQTGTGAYSGDAWVVPYSGGTPINPATLTWNQYSSSIFTVVGQPSGSAQIYYDSIYFY